MLVLSRKPGERILIGDNVAVTIVRIGPNSVRLGIDAPRDMNIVREELCIEVPIVGPNGEIVAGEGSDAMHATH
jgi:carbon storage regulator